jgi:hypothetical protein
VTLPHEEVNSLNGVREFLYDLLDPKKTPRVPRAVRLRAHRLAKHFPMSHRIDAKWEREIAKYQ